jgi:hypothetical protein
MKKVLPKVFMMICLVVPVFFFSCKSQPLVQNLVEGNVGQGDFEWENDEAGGVTITAYLGKAAVLPVPARLDGKPVNAIGADVFAFANLTAAVIPDSVASIGSYAFSSNNLTAIIIPANVTAIGDYAFQNNNLISITLGANVNLGSNLTGDTDFNTAYLNANSQAGVYTRANAASGNWSRR